MAFKKVDSLKRIAGSVYSIEANETEFVLEKNGKDVLSQYVWEFNTPDPSMKRNLAEFQTEIAMLETATALARSWVQHQLEKMEKMTPKPKPWPKSRKPKKAKE
jgi:hypothetical protein